MHLHSVSQVSWGDYTTCTECTFKGQQRHSFYARAFPAQPPSYESVKVPSLGNTNDRHCQTGLKALKRVKSSYPKPEGRGLYGLAL
jgi:hypothetical protein